MDTALATNARGSHMVAVQRDGRRAWTSNMVDGTVTEFDVDCARRSGRSPSPRTRRDRGDAGRRAGLGGEQHRQDRDGRQRRRRQGPRHDQRLRPALPRRRVAHGARRGRERSRSRTGSGCTTSARERSWRRSISPARRAWASAGRRERGPEGITFDPIADFAYVTLHGTNQVVAVDLRTRKVIGFGAVGAGPDGIGFSPLVRR